MMQLLNENKEALIIMIICFVLTGGNIWIHKGSPPTSWSKTEQYGISFRHPAGFRFTSNTPTSWIPGYWEGGIKGEPTTGEMEIIGIYWITDKAGTEDKGIEYIVDLAKDENPSLSIQAIKTMNINDKVVSFSNVDLEIDGIKVTGALCAFRDPFGRIILPYHLKYPGSYDFSLDVLNKIVNSIETKPPIKPRKLTTYWPTEAWRYAAPEEMGVDRSLLQDMDEDIRSRSPDIKVDSVVVVKNGYIVFEEYFNEYNPDTPHIIYSCTKSVISTIFGIAYENGTIPSLNTKLIDLFPDLVQTDFSKWKESITLKDLLKMTAGLEARDSWLYEWEKLGDLHDAPDAVKYILDLPMDSEPGSRFEYTNAVSHLLSCIITEMTGKSAADYGKSHLFDPLGIYLHQWDTDNMGRNWGYNGIYITPHDMAKIGYLFLNKGEWDGTQIISSEWVREATTHWIDANLVEGYGYQWWIGDGYYTAIGYKGQFIFVFPEHNLIFVCTGGNPETYEYSIQLPWKYIIPAME